MEFEDNTAEMKKAQTAVAKAKAIRRINEAKPKAAKLAKLMKLSREDLKRSAKILKLKGYGNKSKRELAISIMDAGEKVRLAEYNAEGVILTIREALGLSTSGNLKSRTAGLRKSKIDDAKSPKVLAQEALVAVRAAMAASNRSPKLSKQFKTRIANELEKFEKDLKKLQ